MVHPEITKATTKEMIIITKKTSIIKAKKIIKAKSIIRMAEESMTEKPVDSTIMLHQHRDASDLSILRLRSMLMRRGIDMRRGRDMREGADMEGGDTVAETTRSESTEERNVIRSERIQLMKKCHGEILLKSLFLNSREKTISDPNG